MFNRPLNQIDLALVRHLKETPDDQLTYTSLLLVYATHHNLSPNLKALPMNLADYLIDFVFYYALDDVLQVFHDAAPEMRNRFDILRGCPNEYYPRLIHVLATSIYLTPVMYLPGYTRSEAFNARQVKEIEELDERYDDGY